MIVKCEKCQTRFKIPDDKVTDRGVKVRCTKCQNTFRVTKADAADAPRAEAGTARTTPKTPTRGLKPKKTDPLDELLRTPAPGSAPSKAPDPFIDMAPSATSSAPPLNDLGIELDMPAPHTAPASSARAPAPSIEFGDLDAGSGLELDVPSPRTPARGTALQPAEAPPRPAAPSVPLARLQLVKAQAPEVSVEAPPAAQRTGGWVSNLTTAAAMLLILLSVGAVYLNEGKLDALDFSSERFKSLLGPAGPLVVTDLSNGLYETQQGRPVFYVRGQIENRSTRPAKAKVRAEILDGAQLVRGVEALAGTTPSPEDLYAITTASDADALLAKLDKRANVLRGGGKAPFVLVFYEYPPDLSTYRLHVTVSEAPSASASR